MAAFLASEHVDERTQIDFSRRERLTAAIQLGVLTANRSLNARYDSVLRHRSIVTYRPGVAASCRSRVSR